MRPAELNSALQFPGVQSLGAFALKLTVTFVLVLASATKGKRLRRSGSVHATPSDVPLRKYVTVPKTARNS